MCVFVRVRACVFARTYINAVWDKSHYLPGKKETRTVAGEMVGFKGEKRESDVTERLQLKRNSNSSCQV